MKFLYGFLLILSMAGAAEPRCVPSKGKGEAAIVNGDIPAAKAEALARAKWDAIDQALGTKTRVESVMENFEMLDEVIVNDVQGFVTEVKVLEETVYQDAVVTAVEGCVYPDKAEKVLSAISLETALALMVVFEDAPDASDENNPFQAEISQQLLDEGYTVLDSGGERLESREMERILLGKSYTALREIMRQNFSGAAIVGKVTKTVPTKAGDSVGYGVSSPFYVVTSRFSYNIVVNEDGQMKKMASKTVKARGRAADLPEAVQKSYVALGDKAGEDIVATLSDLRANKEKTVILTVEGVRKPEQGFAVRERLQKIPFVGSVEIKSLGKYRIRYTGRTEHLAQEIDQLDSMELLKFSPARIQASWRY